MQPHRHQGLTHESAHTIHFGRSSQLQIEFCVCGSFRLSGCKRWVVPEDAAPEPSITLKNAAIYLQLSPRTISRLLAAKVLRGVKRTIPLQPFHARRWEFRQQDLDAFRFARERRG